MKKSQHGFTLIEVMIVVVIVGILASIAYPSYRNYVLRTNRAEGAAHIMRVLQAQERHHSQNMAYIAAQTALQTALDDLGVPANSETGKYSISTMAACTNSTIERCVSVTATAASTDPVCGSMTMTSRGEKSPSACW